MYFSVLQWRADGVEQPLHSTASIILYTSCLALATETCVGPGDPVTDAHVSNRYRTLPRHDRSALESLESQRTAFWHLAGHISVPTTVQKRPRLAFGHPCSRSEVLALDLALRVLISDSRSISTQLREPVLLHQSSLQWRQAGPAPAQHSSFITRKSECMQEFSLCQHLFLALCQPHKCPDA